MKNGENITPYRTKSIIIPKPGSESQYYIFSYNAFNVPGNNNNTLSVIVYAIVDIKASSKIQAAPVMQLSKGNFLTDEYSYQFQVSYRNKCEEWFLGNIHKPIRLTAREDEENNLIDLSWSAYNFWTESTMRYEVWWSFNDASQYQQVGTILADTLASINAVENFYYLLKVMAVRSDGIFTSLSNEVKVDFVRELVIPNVITPNQDGFNDTFEIKNIELYLVNRLIIFNRYGKVLLDQPGYRGGWNGSEISAGIYYFTLLLPENQKEYNGWLQVIR